jgi:hypothetical protein
LFIYYIPDVLINIIISIFNICHILHKLSGTSQKKVAKMSS